VEVLAVAIEEICVVVFVLFDGILALQELVEDRALYRQQGSHGSRELLSADVELHLVLLLCVNHLHPALHQHQRNSGPWTAASERHETAPDSSMLEMSNQRRPSNFGIKQNPQIY
jgi:hypothetical protein